MALGTVTRACSLTMAVSVVVRLALGRVTTVCAEAARARSANPIASVGIRCRPTGCHGASDLPHENASETRYFSIGRHSNVCLERDRNLSRRGILAMQKAENV